MAWRSIPKAGSMWVRAPGSQVIDRKGRHLGTIRVPAIVRNAAFAGPDRRTLFMTAFGALYRVDLLSRGPSGRAN